MSRRLLVVCPGRGSYSADDLGSLADRPEAADVLDACDANRRDAGLPTVRELDAAPRFSGARHLAGEHASLLTFARTMADLRALGDWEIVGVLGNSMGWYTALAAAGALSLDDGIALIATMGDYQRRNVVGGQLLYPTWGDDWQPDAAALAAVDAALAAAEGHAWPSIRLGGLAVLAGDDHGLRALEAHLPPTRRGERDYPLRLPLHSAFHTPLMQPAADRAADDLTDLDWRPPAVPLIDGDGFVHRPRWADPAALRDYTLGRQVTATFDFDAALHAALAHTAPDVVAALGPGGSMGGPCARLLVRLGWAGLRTREAFLERQASDAPLLLTWDRDSARLRGA